MNIKQYLNHFIFGQNIFPVLLRFFCAAKKEEECYDWNDFSHRINGAKIPNNFNQQ
jgi:hypothetical protein